MRISKWIIAFIAALALSTPVAAGDRHPDPLTQLDPQVLFGGAVSEADVSLFFGYLRAALLAASEGRELPVPDELKRRAEALGNELRLRGTLAGLLILGAVEQSAKDAMREFHPAPALPPTSPFKPTRN